MNKLNIHLQFKIMHYLLSDFKIFQEKYLRVYIEYK